MIDWTDIRYRGDLDDVEELRTTYQVDGYLAAYEDRLGQERRGLRERLMRDALRLGPDLSPRIYRIFEETCAALGLESDAEIYCTRETAINAFAAVDRTERGNRALIGISAPSLELLDDVELRSVLGHELGHQVFGNHLLNGLLSHEEGKVTVLPMLGEGLFLRWRKKAELSADRIGLVASGDFHASARALIKAHFGLSEKNLNLDIDRLLAQIEALAGDEGLAEAAFESHPLLPIRLKALELFSRSEKAARAGLAGAGAALGDEALEDHIDLLVRLTSRHPVSEIARAVMNVVAHGGVRVLGADREISDTETKILLEILWHHFTDEPETVIVADPKEAARHLDEAIAAVNREGGPDDKTFIISRLADVALADGALLRDEGKTILEIATQLGLPEKLGLGILIGAAQEVGFRVDVKLNRAATELKRNLAIGAAKALEA